MSRIITQERELSAKSSVLTNRQPDMQPRNIFGCSPLVFLSDTTFSSNELSATTQTSLVSSEFYEHVGKDIEGDLSVQLSSLAVCSEQDNSLDSFSSAPDSKHNK